MGAWSRRPLRGLVLAAGTGLVLGSATPGTGRLEAQDIRAVGIVAGRVEAEQVWKPTRPTEDRSGIVVGAFVDVEVPFTAFGIVAEVVYAQRGGRFSVEDPVPGASTVVENRSDYLSFPLQVKVRYELGPVGVYILGGPTLSWLLSTRVDPSFDFVFLDGKGVEAAATGGLGVELRPPGGFLVAIESRWSEGFTPAYDRGEFELRNRSWELIGRIGRRPTAGLTSARAGDPASRRGGRP